MEGKGRVGKERAGKGNRRKGGAPLHKSSIGLADGKIRLRARINF